MDASVIIVSWNAKKFLLDCLETVYSDLNGLDHEVIVVDNASGDGSAGAVKEFYPKALVIENSSNEGFARANNTGIKKSSGEFILLINSDVKVIPGCIPALLKFLSEHGSAGVVGPMVLNGDLTLQKTSRRFPNLAITLLSALGIERTFLPHNETREAQALSGCFLAVRREALIDVGLLDERFFFYAEDKDWCKRFSDAGWKAFYHPEAKAIHYGGASSAKAPVKFYIEMHRANLQYWEKHHGSLSKAAYLFIMIIHQALRILRGAALYMLRPSSREEAAYKIKRSSACLRWMLCRTIGLNIELA